MNSDMPDDSPYYWSDNKLIRHALVMIVGVWWLLIPSLIFKTIECANFASWGHILLVSAAIILWFCGFTQVSPMVYLQHSKNAEDIMQSIKEKSQGP